jgi:predicted ATPase
VKGKKAEVHAFRVGGRLQHRRSLPGAEGQLAGREIAVAALREALETLRSGDGRVVELSGDPGIGKSRLLGEMIAMASGMRCAVVRCEPYASGTPYAAAGYLIRELLGEPIGSAPEAAATVLAAIVDSRAPELKRWLSLLATVVGAKLPLTPEASQLDAEFRRVRLEEAAAELLATMLPGQAVLAVEDVEFADEASASLLQRLTGEVTGRPWLIVLTGPSRSPFPVPDDVKVLRLALRPLPAGAAEAMLREATEQPPLSPHQLAAIRRRAAGNPLFLRELAALAARGGDSGVLPESAEGVIAAEIDQLAPADRATLRSAAVIGTSFDARLLARVLGRSLEQGVWDRLQNLIAAEADGGYRFRHARVCAGPRLLFG